jgi:hypothetical protein
VESFDSDSPFLHRDAVRGVEKEDSSIMDLDDDGGKCDWWKELKFSIDMMICNNPSTTKHCLNGKWEL